MNSLSSCTSLSRHLKIKAIEIPKPWLNRLGSYRVINTEQTSHVTNVRLFKRNKRLYLSYHLPKLTDEKKILLYPSSDNVAISEGLGRSRGETIHVKPKDGQTSELLYYSGLVLEKSEDLFNWLDNE